MSTDGVREEGAWETLPPLLLKTLEAWPEKSVKANLLASLRQVVVMKRMSQRKRRHEETHWKARLEHWRQGQHRGKEFGRTQT